MSRPQRPLGGVSGSQGGGFLRLFGLHLASDHGLLLPLGATRRPRRDQISVLKNLGRTVFIIAVAGLGIVFLVLPFMETKILQRANTSAYSQLELVRESLDQRIKRFAPLPQLIAQQSSLLALLQDADNDGLVPFVNEQLRLLAINIGGADVYLIAPDGTTVATSNYRSDSSFLGNNYDYRPYFTEALRGAASQFHALGTTSSERGFFFSAPVVDGTEVAGVLVVKMTVDMIDAAWGDLDHEIIVADANGVVFMGSRPEWRFRTLTRLTAGQKQIIHETRQFPVGALVPLNEPLNSVGTDDVRMDVLDGDETLQFYTQSVPVALRGWHAIVLTPATVIRRQTWFAAAYWCTSVFVLLLIAYLISQRQAQRREVERLQMAERDLLEKRVDERTIELNKVNLQLVDKIKDHQAAEAELRNTQKELVQAGKLASLGQMSAALSHEINQPLAAIRAYAGNAVDFLDKDRTGSARENIVHISDMTDRIARISKHLTNFARQSGDTLGAVSVSSVVEEAITLVMPKVRKTGAHLEFDRPDIEYTIIGGHLRLLQVVVNLLSNGIDAGGEAQTAVVRVRLEATADTVSIFVSDNGPGLAPDVADQIFDPFFTTKEAGKGMGLGLSISFNIIEDFGGKILVANHPDGGAEFELVLKRTHEQAEAIT